MCDFTATGLAQTDIHTSIERETRINTYRDRHREAQRDTEIDTHRFNSVLHPSRVNKQSTSLNWLE